MAFYGNQYVTAMQVAQQRALNDLMALSVLELRRGFIDAIKAQGAAVDGQLRAMAHAFDSRNDRAEFQRIHQRVGELAQDSVLRSYAAKVTGREGPASRTHYRGGQNRLPNTLRKALANPKLFEATPDGLRWVNISMLDHEAAHWHRLNFGAVGRGQGSSAHFKVTFNNLVLATLGYDEGPSPGVFLPPGFWLGSDGQRVAAGASARGADRFFPGGQRPAGIRGLKGQEHGRRQRIRQTAGIEAKNFLDAGLKRIADEFPKGYEQHYQNIVHKFTTGQRRIAVPAIIKGENSPFRNIRTVRF